MTFNLLTINRPPPRCTTFGNKTTAGHRGTLFQKKTTMGHHGTNFIWMGHLWYTFLRGEIKHRLFRCHNLLCDCP